MMGMFDYLYDVGAALGNGVVSVGVDLYYGAERTAQGLGASGWDRTAEIGAENEYLVGHLIALVRSAPNAPNNPLYRLITTILKAYYDQFPEDALQKVAKAAGIGGAYMVGRMVIGKALAEKIALRIAAQIAATAAYRQFATKIGVSAAAGSTGVGAVITLVMVQGVAQRASKASQRLKARNVSLWNDLRRQQGLDMLFFLVEAPLAKYMDAIDLAHRNAPLFRQEVQRLYQQQTGR
jgi:hypothetical protein